MTCANLTSFFFSRTRCRRNWLFTRRTLTSLMPSWTCCSRKGKRRRWHWKTEMERRITSIPKYPPFSPPPTQSRPLCWKYCHGPTYILLPVRSSFFPKSTGFLWLFFVSLRRYCLRKLNLVFDFFLFLLNEILSLNPRSSGGWLLKNWGVWFQRLPSHWPF